MIQVICRAMSIIEYLGTNPRKEFSVAEISGALNLDKGTCTNILKTMASRGFVQQRAPRSGYKLGYTLYKITGNSVDNDELTKIARVDVEKLGTELNETAILSVIRNDKRVTLFATTPDRDLVVRTPGGKSVYAANSGRVILANYTADHLEKFIIRKGLPEKDEWPEVAEAANQKGEMMNTLLQIKRDGYSIMCDRNEIVGFAAPLFHLGHVAGSVGVYLPKSRISSEKYLLDAVLLTARNINKKIAQTYQSD